MPATSAETAPTSCQCRRNNLKGVISASSFSTWVHYQRKAGPGSSRLGPFSRPYSAKCVEGVFRELRPNGVLEVRLEFFDVHPRSGALEVPGLVRCTLASAGGDAGGTRWRFAARSP